MAKYEIDSINYQLTPVIIGAVPSVFIYLAAVLLQPSHRLIMQLFTLNILLGSEERHQKHRDKYLFANRS